MKQAVKQKHKKPNRTLRLDLKRNRKRHRRSIIRRRAEYNHKQFRTALIICTAFAMIAVLGLVYVFWNGFEAEKDYERLASDNVFEDVTEAANEETTEGWSGRVSAWNGTGAVLTVDFVRLLSENADTVAWLHVPAADVSYPVVHHAENNDYYLHRAFDGTDSAAGSIYLEYTNTPDFTDRHSLIYGHNMNDGSMFGSLQRSFHQKDVAEITETYFYLYLPDGSVNRYYVFSFYETDKDSDTYLTFTEDNAYDWYVHYAKTASEAGRNADGAESYPEIFLSRPPIVTLSTCSGPSGTSGRFVIHGVLTDHLKKR